MTRAIMRIDRIRFQNFRCFEDRELELASRFNLVIGDNGTGKTTVLSGLSLAIRAILATYSSVREPNRRDARAIARNVTQWNNGTSNVEPQYPVLIGSEGILQGKEVDWELSQGTH